MLPGIRPFKAQIFGMAGATFSDVLGKSGSSQKDTIKREISNRSIVVICVTYFPEKITYD
jgi:hypothetical protein